MHLADAKILFWVALEDGGRLYVQVRDVFTELFCTPPATADDPAVYDRISGYYMGSFSAKLRTGIMCGELD